MPALAPPPPAVVVPDREAFTIAQLSAFSGYSPWMLRTMWRNRMFKATVYKTEKRTTILVPRDEAERLVRELQPRFATEADLGVETEEGQD